MAVIDVQGLTKRFGETVANDDVSFTVHAGEIFGFLGPNGAGKTTTIRLLLGLLTPTAGGARVLGCDIDDRSAFLEAKRNLGYLPADPAFDEDVTGETFLDYHASLKGDDRRTELLNLFDPPLDRKIREYSSGNRQMLGIIQAFMHDPALVIMDEPTSGLDPLKQERFNAFLRDERQAGKTIFLSSHVLGEVRRVCDRVGIIRDGQMVTVEEIETLLERGGKRVRINTDDALSREELDVEGIVAFEQVGRETQFTFTGNYNDLLEVLADHDVVDLEIDEPPIEDVFMHFYGASNA